MSLPRSGSRDAILPSQNSLVPGGHFPRSFWDIRPEGFEGAGCGRTTSVCKNSTASKDDTLSRAGDMLALPTFYHKTIGNGGSCFSRQHVLASDHKLKRYHKGGQDHDHSELLR